MFASVFEHTLPSHLQKVHCLKCYNYSRSFKKIISPGLFGGKQQIVDSTAKYMYSLNIVLFREGFYDALNDKIEKVRLIFRDGPSVTYGPYMYYH